MIKVDPADLHYEKMFSICTMVNDIDCYKAMVDSYIAAGFGDDCEYLYIDNSKKNIACAYKGLNRLMNQAKGKYIILCHQDIFIKSSKNDLEQRLSELDNLDPKWGIVGNSGGIEPGKFSVYIVAPDPKQIIDTENVPSKVQTLDENWMLIKSETRLSFSNDLTGFHLYGSDICLHAEILGYTCYTIKFLLRHYGEGRINDDYKNCMVALSDKYKKLLNHKTIQTTCSQVYI